MTTNSTWAALRNPAFRKLWIAAVISGTCVAAHDSAATWTINPVGVRGIAENSISGTSAAIANAVYSATVKRVRNFPITPEKLLLPEGSEPPKTRLTSEPA